MPLFRSVKSQRWDIASTRQSTFTNVQIGKLFACRRNRMKSAARSAIINDAEKLRSQTKHLPQPVKCDLLKFCRRRTRMPEHTIDIESCGKQFTENTRRTA